MNNLILFINSFLSYLLVFAVFAVCIIIASLLGVALRKHLNKKADMQEETQENSVS